MLRLDKENARRLQRSIGHQMNTFLCRVHISCALLNLLSGISLQLSSALGGN